LRWLDNYCEDYTTFLYSGEFTDAEVLLTIGKLFSDSTGVTDSISLIRGLNSVLSETSNISEIIAMSTGLRLANDVANTSDSISLGAGSKQSDTTTTSDSGSIFDDSYGQFDYIALGYSGVVARTF
jgi:hypothetical protein